MLYPNGIYIQDVLAMIPKSPFGEKFSFADVAYNGVARYMDLPLCRIHDPITEAISKKMYSGKFSVYKDCSNDFDVEPLCVITSIEYYNEYIQHCKELNIETKVFFIKSTHKYPLWLGEPPKLKVMGYEVASVDLCEPTFIKMLNSDGYKKYAKKLNTYGLFDDFETAKTFFDELNEKEHGLIEEHNALIVEVNVIIED